jgi:hypothetical protein
MTLPGHAMRESVDRLAQTISAAKAHSDELKAQAGTGAARPVALQEVTGEPRSGDQQGAT